MRALSAGSLYCKDLLYAAFCTRSPALLTALMLALSLCGFLMTAVCICCC